jgi:3-hydroxybutyryl-CoA dehydrogenase
MNIQKIGVIGAGTMGGGIAQVAAQNGFEVVLQDMKEEHARTRFAKIKERLEKEDIRKQIFKNLDNICRKETVFATNTSSISITRLAQVTGRPLGMAYVRYG